MSWLPRMITRAVQVLRPIPARYQYAGRHTASRQLFGLRPLSTVRLLDISQTDNSVHLELNSRGKSIKTNLHNFWLRDSCQCPQCYDATTNQRLADTASLSIDIKPSQVSVDDHSSLIIHWQDGHESKYPRDWLLKNALEAENGSMLSFEPIAWGREIESTPPQLDYGELMTQDKGVLDLYNKMEVYGFCLVQDTPHELAATEDLINRIGMVRHTFYGGLAIIEANSEKNDTAYSNLAIEPHTDGNYFQDPPGMIVFHCVKFEGSKPCLNYLLDGQKLCQTIKEENPDDYQILCNVPLSYHHSDKTHKYLNSHVPFIFDPKTGKFVEMHFNNHDRLPLNDSTLDALHKIKPEGTLVDVYKAIQTLMRATRRRDLQFEIRLEPGTVLILDNYRLMHARSDYEGHRAVIGTYINREDLMSTVMTLQEKLSCS